MISGRGSERKRRGRGEEEEGEEGILTKDDGDLLADVIRHLELSLDTALSGYGLSSRLNEVRKCCKQTCRGQALFHLFIL